MFHSAVGHRRRTTSDVALSAARFAKRPASPISSTSTSTSAQAQPTSALAYAHSQSFDDSTNSFSSSQEQDPCVSNDEVEDGGQGEGEEEEEEEEENVKRVVLRKHRSDEIPGTRSLAQCLARSEVDAMNGFWSRRVSTSKNKRNATAKAREQQAPSDQLVAKVCLLSLISPTTAHLTK